MAEGFDDRLCDLGEGPLWHPTRNSLIWFDINGGRLLERQGDTPRYWQFEGPVTAAGLLPGGDLLIASHVALQRFNLDTGASEVVHPLEANLPKNRSNDGRADGFGSFWIGTMARLKTPGDGAIYRLYRGELRKLHSDITISNSICFSPDRSKAYFTDTPRKVIWSQALDEDGWPASPPEPFVTLAEADGYPDGAVCDAEGYVWSARWGTGEVVRHAPNGQLDTVVKVPVSQVSCPAFGGPDARTLYCTTAREELSPEQLRAEPLAGATFKLLDDVPGRFEPEVAL